MLRLVLIFVLALLTIPHIQSQSDTTEYAEVPSSIIATTAVDILPTIFEPVTEVIIVTQTLISAIIPVQTTQQSATEIIVVTSTEQTSTTTTTFQPLRPIFSCNFTDPCFGNGQLEITDGREFNSDNLIETSEPPRAPTSDVTSITQPTSDNKNCVLPYRPQVNNGAFVNWDMWFCNNNTCPTGNLTPGKCAEGSYGLLSLTSSQTSVTVVDSVSSSIVPGDSVGEQCLRFWYYFTVYNGEDWGQRIQLWIRPNNETVNQYSIRNLTVADMRDNKWNSQNITFNSTFINYTLAFLFEVTIVNRTEDAALNKTIYFALDNIELYNYSCSYVDNAATNPPLTQQPTTESPPANTTSSSPSTTTEQDLTLILGLSLGIGIPVLLAIIFGLIYYFKVRKPKNTRITPNNDNAPTNTTTAAIVDIPLAPIKPTNDDSTIAAVVV